jgi:hypothetical protein
MPRKQVHKSVVPRVRNTNRGRRGTRYTRYFATPVQMASYKARLKQIKKRKLGL